MPTLSDLHGQAMAMIVDVPEGDALDALDTALIDLGVRASVTCLDTIGIATAIAAAKTAGATTEQMQEVIALVSALGVHSLMATAPAILAAAGGAAEPLTTEQASLWARYVGDEPYWRDFEEDVPGVLDALLRTAPTTFEGFFAYCAIPWQTRCVRSVTKELVAIACDASRSHRFGPGLRLHVRNALKLGAGRRAIMRALEIAAAAPEHDGVA